MRTATLASISPSKMPRRNSVKDRRTVYIAHRYGLDRNGNEIFGSPIEKKAVVSLYGGESPDAEYGTAHEFSFEILFDKDKDTKFVNLYTRVWLNTIPLDSTDSPDCIITSPPQEANGQILVSCTSTAVNESEFFYEVGGKILSFVARDDLENNKFYTAPNVYLPVDNSTKMWYLEPVDIDDEECSMRFVEKKEHKNYVEYTVELDG